MNPAVQQALEYVPAVVKRVDEDGTVPSGWGKLFKADRIRVKLDQARGELASEGSGWTFRDDSPPEVQQNRPSLQAQARAAVSADLMRSIETYYANEPKRVARLTDKGFEGPSLAVTAVNAALSVAEAEPEPTIKPALGDVLDAVDRAPFYARGRGESSRPSDETAEERERRAWRAEDGSDNGVFQSRRTRGAYHPAEQPTVIRQADRNHPRAKKARARLRASYQASGMSTNDVDVMMAWIATDPMKSTNEAILQQMSLELGCTQEAARKRRDRMFDRVAQRQGYASFKAQIEAEEAERTARVDQSMQTYLTEELGVKLPSADRANKSGWVNIKCPYHDSQRKTDAAWHPAWGLFKCWVRDCPTREVDPQTLGIGLAKLEKV